jgi:predicted heme/steroid binding protein
VWSKQASSESAGPNLRLTQEEIDFHKEKTEIAREVMKKLIVAEDGADFDKVDGSDGLAPPSADVPEAHFKRRLLVNEVLAATEDMIWNAGQSKTVQKAKSCVALGYTGLDARVHPAVSAALEQAVKERSKIFKAAAYDFQRGSTPENAEEDDDEQAGLTKRSSAPSAFHFRETPQAKTLTRLTSVSRANKKGIPMMPGESMRKDSSAFAKDKSIASLTKPMRRASMLHDEVNHLLKTDGMEMAKLTPPSHEKPVLKDPMGIKCVAHLHDPKWTKLARAIRESIYDPDFYDDGTYGPMYVRLAIHGAATYDRHDGTGGLEGGAMRYKPEYSDAHNKFCKPIVKRQHELFKVPFPWASYADIQCLCAYVTIECANGPVIPFTPGRRDVLPPKDLKDTVTPKVEGEDFVVLNYRERGDIGYEDEPVRICPASGKTEDPDGGCPFLRKAKVYPGRVPGPEQGHLGKPCAPVTKEAEKKEMEEVAKEIRHIFCHRIGATEQLTVALIAGGHSLGRCHPQISGYAGPWQSNPGYFNNVYCKKLLSDDWKCVDRTMEDCSGDIITGVKPYGMRRQYVNKGGKGDLMMLVSDLALREDPYFGYWIQEYALDNNKLKKDFAVAFKWATELGFEPPKEKRGTAKLKFAWRKFKFDCLNFMSTICYGGEGGAAAPEDAGAPVIAASDAPKVGKPYTMEEVKAHSSQGDCWVAINGKVCNLTDFINSHPGGVAPIMGKAGKDASVEWNGIHNPDAIEKIAPDVVIGYLVESK